MQALLAMQASGGSSMVMLLPMVAIFAIFYFLLILPQQKRQKKWAQMVSELKTGDRVVTSGGIRGIVQNLKDDALVLKIAPDGLKIEVMRSAVLSVEDPEAGK